MKLSGMKTSTRRSSETIHILEDIAQTRGKLRVDLDAGIIYNVKFLGFTSPNRHGRSGVKQTRYKPEAVANALHLYEGKQIYKNHPEDRKALAERKFDDLLGEIYDCRLESDGAYGNLRVIKGDPDAEKLLRVAKQMPHLIGLSHNADGRGYVDGRTEEFLIESIPVVRSVDVVTRPATTLNLMESRERTVAGKKFSIKKILESRGWKKTAEIIALLEDDALGMDAAEPMPDIAAPADEGDALDWREHLKNAVKAILDDETLSEEDVKKGINSILATLKTGTDSTGGESEEGGEEDEEEPEEKMESIELKVKRFEARDECVELCESMEYIASREEINILADIPTEARRKTTIERFKAAASNATVTTTAPITGGSAKNRQRVSTLESQGGDKPAKTTDDFLTRITGGAVAVAEKK